MEKEKEKLSGPFFVVKSAPVSKQQIPATTLDPRPYYAGHSFALLPIGVAGWLRKGIGERRGPRPGEGSAEI